MTSAVCGGGIPLIAVGLRSMGHRVVAGRANLTFANARQS